MLNDLRKINATTEAN